MTHFHILLLLSLIFVPAFAHDILCSFNAGTCDWDIRDPWNLVSVARIPGFAAQIREIKSSGPFLLAQGKFGTARTGQAASQVLSESQHMRILAYRYQRQGAATLRVFLASGEKTSQPALLLLDSIVAGGEAETTQWSRRSVLIPPIRGGEKNATRLVFECDNIQTSRDFIALDSVEMATPANVAWSGQDSKLFDEQDLRRREIRRKEVKTCDPIRCVFHSTTCRWTSSNIQKLPSKIVNEAGGEAILTSDPIHLDPSGSSSGNLRIQMFDSPGSQTIISMRSVSGAGGEQILWRKDPKDTVENGWRRVTVALVPTASPFVIILKCVNVDNEFCAFQSIDFVDDAGKSTSCGSSTVGSPIRPTSSTEKMIRLTAVQNLRMSPIEKLLYLPPAATPQTPQRSPPKFETSFSSDDAVLPISPAQVSTRGVPIVPLLTLPFKLPGNFF